MIDWSKLIKADDIRREERAAEFPDLSMRQFRLALLSAGLLSKVDEAIASLPEPSRSAALIEWEYSMSVRRDHGLVSMLAPTMGLTDSQIDEMWTAAKSI